MKRFLQYKTNNIITYAQVLLVLLTFALMVFSSYIFVKGIEHRHLLDDAEGVLSHTQAKVTADLLQAETMLDIVSHTVKDLISHGGNANRVSEYMKKVSDDVLNDKKHTLGASGFYGVFDKFNGLFINDGGWDPPADYIPADRPWYKAAVEAQGKIIATPTYLDLRTNSSAITFTRRLFDDNGHPLGIVGLDVSLDSIGQYILSMHVPDGYGLLMNEYLEIVAHPHPEWIGKNMTDLGGDMTALANEVKRGTKISEREITNYNGEKAVVFMQKLNNGWYIGSSIVRDKYYKSTINLAIIMGLIGFIFSLILIVLLLHITKNKNKAEESNRFKSRFLSYMSHEIRTPMNAIIGATEIQLQDETLMPHVREGLMMIYSSSGLLLSIINNILDLSKIEAGKMELVPIKYEITSLVNDVVQLNTMHSSKHIEFEFYIDENMPAELIGDEVRIKQILSNLLSNAFKYTEKGKIKLSVSAKAVTRDDATLVFTVSDTGHGMNEEQVSKLFTAEFVRFNLESNRLIEGTGLGMNITQNLVQMMNGNISVESKSGKGTKFTVNLPQKIAGESIIGREQAENLMKSRAIDTTRIKGAQFIKEYMPYGKVMIVDDVESNLHVARGLMSPYGLAIDIVSDGVKAVEKIKNGNVYDVIFMDHMMPKMSGIEATRKIRELGYKHPIVALTANALVGQAKVFMENGFDDYISKPIDIRQLNNVLNKLIRDKQPPEVLAKAKERDKARKHKHTPVIDATLLSIFVKDAKKVLPIFEHTLENIADISDDDLYMFAIKAHSIKSALANIGEEVISQMAFVLETAARRRDKTVISLQTRSLIKSLKGIITKVEAEAEKRVSDSDEDYIYLREQLNIICRACDDYNIATSDMAIASLRKMSWTKETEDAIDKISESLLHSDFKEAKTLAENYGGFRK